MTVSEVPETTAGTGSGAPWGAAAAAFTRWRDGDSTGLEDLVRLLSPVLWQVVRATGLDLDDQLAPGGVGDHLPGSTLCLEERPDLDLVARRERLSSQLDQVADGGLQTVDPAQRVHQLLAVVRRRVAERVLELDADPGERGAELVRRVRTERTLALHEHAETLGGGVERFGRLVELGHACPVGADAEVAAAQAADRHRQLFDRFGQPARLEPGGDGGEQQDGRGQADHEQPRAVDATVEPGGRGARPDDPVDPLGLHDRHRDGQRVAGRSTLRLAPQRVEHRPVGVQRVGAGLAEAVAPVDADLVGVNNRNLKTLAVDLATTEQLAPMVPKDRVLVSESGLGSPADLARMARVGAAAFLIGESFMRQADVEAAVRAILVRETAAA